jgi:CheY-like chemotaxis protein
MERRRLPLAELRKYVERHFLPIAQQKSLDFSIRLGEGVPPWVFTDSQRLEQILKNLLSNAFKFTDEGEVSLDIALARTTRRFQNPALRNAPGAIAFVVRDTGIGIPLEKQQIIFEAFQQADASTSRTYGGTGLGLTISRELARLLGGEITLESRAGSGSTFTLYLPLVDEERARVETANHIEIPKLTEPLEWPVVPRIAMLSATAPPPATDDAHGARTVPDLSHRKVLVVDDDVRNLFAVASLLEAHGAEVLSASSAREAIELLERHGEVDIVLMDIMMPEVDGYEATRRIRCLPQFSRLPIIALTAKAMPGDREKCLGAGCNDFVCKPVDSLHLLETIQRALVGKDGRS